MLQYFTTVQTVQGAAQSRSFREQKSKPCALLWQLLNSCRGYEMFTL